MMHTLTSIQVKMMCSIGDSGLEDFRHCVAISGESSVEAVLLLAGPV